MTGGNYENQSQTKIITGAKLSADERDYMGTLAILIGEWEKKSERINAFRNELPVLTPQKLLESFMNDHGLSQSSLAKQIRCNQSSISEFISGERELSKALIVKLADFFKVSTDVFLRQK